MLNSRIRAEERRRGSFARASSFGQRRSGSRLLAAWLLLPAQLLVGIQCQALPRDLPTGSDARERIAAHVEFLARPALKGRKPGTSGSRIARRYIEDRFAEYGLEPWGNHKGYTWSFGYGKNVIGFLPGSQPDLSNEVVLVSAHYDHLGKDSKGRICPGAADNASGVGAILEVARQISQGGPRPARSLLFVSFDCEEMMLLGSFAFCCEKPVQQARIVAEINVDMLGRDLLDVVGHTLFLAGSEGYPSTGQQICRFGARSGIRVLPLGTDLIGPRSDHVAFESRKIPCLFFSCGSFRDYHEPGDTAEKLNYDDLARSAEVIRRTVWALASSPNLERASPIDAGFAQELHTVRVVMDEVNGHLAKAGIRAEDAQAFQGLAREAQELSASGKYTRATRRQLILDASGVLAPYFLPSELTGGGHNADQLRQSRLLLQYLQEFYLRDGPEILEGYRQLVAQLLRYHPGLFHGMPRFQYGFYKMADEDISFLPRAHDRFVLNALADSWTMLAEVKSSKWLIKSFHAYLGGSLDPLDCEGTREQIADFCLLRLRGERTNAEHAAVIKKVLGVVTTNRVEAGYNELLAARLRRGGFVDETDWVVQCLRSGPSELAIQALEAARGSKDERVRAAVCRVMADRDRRADVRAAAIGLAAGLGGDCTFLALCDLLPDATPVFQPEFVPMTRSDYPFANRMSVKAALQMVEKDQENASSKSLGEVAHLQLKRMAKRDLGTDPARWRNWLRSHPSRSSGRRAI